MEYSMFEYGMVWKPETNEFVTFTIGEYIEEQSKKLAFWSAVAKVAKKTHKKENADAWVKYHEQEIRNAHEYGEWKLKND